MDWKRESAMKNTIKKIMCLCVAIVGIGIFAPSYTVNAQTNVASEADTSNISLATIECVNGEVDGNGVRLRKTASTNGTVLESMYDGESVFIDWAKTGNSSWYYVTRIKTGTSGWVSGQYIVAW